jgi:methionine synthase I (cobalamin-dependent)
MSKDCKTVFPGTPKMMAKVHELIERGEYIIGGCCGTTRELIRAMARAITRKGK